jgi:hypothetical protein
MMKIIKASLLCLCQVIYMAIHVEAQGWRGLTPLGSTRKDVERLLGPSKEPDKYAELYDLGNETVFIEYSSGPCHKERDGGWNVPAQTVIEITITPAVHPQLADLRLDLSTYRKTEDPELPGVFYYYHAIDGINITVSDGKVASIEYGPMAKDRHLICPRGKAAQ